MGYERAVAQSSTKEVVVAESVSQSRCNQGANRKMESGIGIYVLDW